MSNAYFLLNAAAFGGYGLMCFMEPFTLEKFAGLSVKKPKHWSGPVEIRAMYGGLQAGIGICALLFWLDPSPATEVVGLRVFTTIMSSIALGRLASLLLDGRSVIPSLQPPKLDQTAPYNAQALWFFEIPNAVIGGLLLSYAS